MSDAARPKPITLKEQGLRLVGDRIVPIGNPRPRRVPCTLYRHFDEDGVLLYVGVSISVLRRLSRHMGISHWSEKIATIKIQRFPDQASALEAEEAAIKAERPLYNIRMSEFRHGPEFTPEFEAEQMAKLNRALEKPAE